MSLIPFVSRAHYLQSGVLIGQQQETRSEINVKNIPEKKKKKKKRLSKRQEVFFQ